MREILAPALSDRTTIHLGGRAIAELCIENEDDLEVLAERLRYYGGSPFFIGHGSNLLARDGELPMTLISLHHAEEVTICGEEQDRILVRASAGTPLKKVLGFCLKQGLSGLEGLVGIPGTVGGAVMMNAGSFGDETADCLHSLKCFVENAIEYYKKSEIKAAYRHIHLPSNERACLVLEAIFALTPMPNNVIFKRMSLNFFKKKSKQPVTAWSGGCAFKNPSDTLAAGKLLEDAGFRGKKLGGMVFSPMHANFLVNSGTGTAAEALELMQMAQNEVFKRFGLLLEPELKLIP